MRTFPDCRRSNRMRRTVQVGPVGGCVFLGSGIGSGERASWSGKFHRGGLCKAGTVEAPRRPGHWGESLFLFSFSGCRFPVQLSKIHGCCPLSFCLNDLVETVSSGLNNERHLADYLLFLNIIVHAGTFAGLIC